MNDKITIVRFNEEEEYDNIITSEIILEDDYTSSVLDALRFNLNIDINNRFKNEEKTNPEYISIRLIKKVELHRNEDYEIKDITSEEQKKEEAYERMIISNMELIRGVKSIGITMPKVITKYKSRWFAYSYMFKIDENYFIGRK